MRNSSKILRRAIVAANQTFQSLFDLDAQVAKAADLIEESLRAGSKLLVCGNGASAANASHFATELVVRFTKYRPAYPAISLSGDGGLLTAAGNDYGFDEVFARQAPSREQFQFASDRLQIALKNLVKSGAAYFLCRASPDACVTLRSAFTIKLAT